MIATVDNEHANKSLNAINDEVAAHLFAFLVLFNHVGWTERMKVTDVALGRK